MSDKIASEGLDWREATDPPQTGETPSPKPADPAWQQTGETLRHPAPQAAQTHKAPRRKRGCLFAALLVLVLLVVCGGLVAYPFYYDATHQVTFDFPPPTHESKVSSYRGAWWGGAGAFGVAQTMDATGMPTLAVWNRATGRVRVIKGLQVVWVEPYGSRAWVLREPNLFQHPEAADEFPDPADGSDWPVKKLLVMALDSTAPLAAVPAPAQWEPWAGPGGVSADLTVDATKGGMPAQLTFRGGTGKSVAANLGQDVRTFVPLGFSPSGKYFAIRPVDRTLAMPIGMPAAHPVTIVSVSTGRVVASASAETTGSGVHTGDVHTSWDGQRDILYYDDTVVPMGHASNGGYGVLPVRYLAPDGSKGLAAQKFGWPAPAELASATTTRIIGPTAAGPLWTVEASNTTAIYRLGTRGLVHTQLHDADPFSITTATSPDGELLMLRWTTPDGALQFQHVAADGMVTTLWNDGIKRTAR